MSIHVTKRGNNRADVFRDERDYVRIIELLQTASTKYRVAVHFYTVMTNHLHLLATPADDSASARASQWCFGQFTRHVNRRFGRTGTIWDGRYDARTIDSEQYWYRCMRYIARNPVAAGIVASPEDYPWSSYRHYAFGIESDWLVPHELYLALGPIAAIRQAAFRSICTNRTQLECFDLPEL